MIKDYKSFETEMMKKYPFINEFTFEADYDNGKPLHICWLKFPIISPSSNTGYFHFDELAEFNHWIKLCEWLEIKDIDKGFAEPGNYGLNITTDAFKQMVIDRRKNHLLLDFSVMMGFNSKIFIYKDSFDEQPVMECTYETITDDLWKKVVEEYDYEDKNTNLGFNINNVEFHFILKE